jgi:hypothetical protein
MAGMFHVKETTGIEEDVIGRNAETRVAECFKTEIFKGGPMKGLGQVGRLEMREAGNDREVWECGNGKKKGVMKQEEEKHFFEAIVVRFSEGGDDRCVLKFQSIML